MARPPVSVTIITLNEESNLTRAIESVRWADEVVIVDSGSTDRTVELAKSLGARVVINPWPGYGKQKNFAQKQVSHDWVLNIDADETVPPALAQEIQDVLSRASQTSTSPKGYSIPRKTFYLGRWIKYGGWYPNYLVRLADRRTATWSEPNVHEALTVSGEVQELKEPLHHFSFPSIQDQILTNLRFSYLGSQDLKRSGREISIAHLLFKPLGKFFETFILKRGFMDGLPGYIISVNAAYSMFLKYAYVIENKLRLKEKK